MVSRFDSRNVNKSLKLWFFYLVADSIRLLDADLLSSLMCTKLDVLFSIIRVVGVWCDILVSAAGFINNGCSYECSMAGLQNKTVYTGKSGHDM